MKCKLFKGAQTNDILNTNFSQYTISLVLKNIIQSSNFNIVISTLEHFPLIWLPYAHEINDRKLWQNSRIK